jgi:hypothetical protein
LSGDKKAVLQSVLSKPGGLDLSQSCVDRDSQSRQKKENLDTLKIIVSRIEISRFSLDGYMQIQYFSVEIGTFRDFSRLVKTFVIICDFCGFLDIFLDLNQEIMDFYKYLDRDFSSQPFLFTFCASKLASKWAKSAENSNFFKKS